MFIAMDNNQKRWNCMEEIPAVTEGPFYCLACHSPVRLKNGSVLRAHFAHIELQHCPYHHEAESFEHLELKASLYDWASKESNTEVESYLADFQQIADLLVVDKNLALEVQCSSLSLERLKERSDDYRSHGYQVYWLLGKKLWLKKRLTKLQAGFLYFSQNIQQQLFYRHPKWLKLQEELYLQGHHLMELGLDFFYPLCRPILSQNLLQIEEDVEDYYQQFMTYYQSQGIQPVQILYPPRFYAQQKS